MPKYTAVFYKTLRYTYEIEADNEAAAREVAEIVGPCHKDLKEDSDSFQFELMDVVEELDESDW